MFAQALSRLKPGCLAEVWALESPVTKTDLGCCDIGILPARRDDSDDSVDHFFDRQGGIGRQGENLVQAGPFLEPLIQLPALALKIQLGLFPTGNIFNRNHDRRLIFEFDQRSGHQGPVRFFLPVKQLQFIVINVALPAENAEENLAVCGILVKIESRQADPVTVGKTELCLGAQVAIAHGAIADPDNDDRERCILEQAAEASFAFDQGLSRLMLFVDIPDNRDALVAAFDADDAALKMGQAARHLKIIFVLRDIARFISLFNRLSEPGSNIRRQQLRDRFADKGLRLDVQFGHAAAAEIDDPAVRFEDKKQIRSHFEERQENLVRFARAFLDLVQFSNVLHCPIDPDDPAFGQDRPTDAADPFPSAISRRDFKLQRIGLSLTGSLLDCSQHAGEIVRFHEP